MQQLPPGFQLDQPAAQPQQSRAPGVIRGPQGAPSISDLTSMQNANRGEAQFQYQMQRDAIEDQRRAEEDARTKREDQEQRTRAEGAARSALLKTIRELNNIAIDADDNAGWFETGTSGRFARSALPGANAGKDLAGNIETLNADFAFSALNAMREASKTGGALGQVTERELDLLKASTANIDPNLSHDTFLENVERARQVYLTRLADIDPQLATRLGYDASKAEEALLALNAEYERRFGDPNAQQPTVTREYRTAPDANRTPEDIEAIMRKYGIEQ